MKNQEFKIAAFYQFTPMVHLEELQSNLRELLESLSVRGTILLAKEGINGTVAGSNKSMDEFELFLKKKKLLNELNFKISLSLIILETLSMSLYSNTILMHSSAS